MALPYLYSADDARNDYTRGGLGALPDCTSLLCSAELNGEVSITGSVPIGKTNVDNVINSNIIKVKINDTQEPQIMRLYDVKKSMASGLVTFKAEPIANDIRSGYLPKFTISNTTAANAMAKMAQASIPAIPPRFNFWSDKDNLSTVELERVSVLQGLGGVEGSILQKFKGEYEKDNHTVKLYKRLGTDHKIKIIYTKNLTGLDIEVDTQGVVNGIYPYAEVEGSKDGEFLEIDGKVLFFDKQYWGGVITPIDFSNQKPVDKAALKKLADSYLANNASLNDPKLTAKIDFVLLNNQPRYKEFVNMESCGLGDGVDVFHPGMGVDLHARIVSYEFDCLLEQYTKLEVGSVKSNFLDQVFNQIDENKQESDGKLNFLEQAQKEVSDIIKNPTEGHVVIYPSLSDPQEILIMDTTDVNTAKKLWRWNSSGLAYSENGYNGDYKLAMTKDGQIVADMMTTGVLRAINIVGVSIVGSKISTQYGKTDYYINMENGLLSFLRNDKDICQISPTFSGTTGKANGVAIVKETDEIFSLNVRGSSATTSSPVFQLPADSSSSNLKYNMYGTGTFLGDTILNYRATAKDGIRISDDSTAGLFPGRDRKSSWLQGETVVVKATTGGDVELKDGNINCYGNFRVFNGSKNAVHVTRDGLRATPAYEMAESYLGDIGRGMTDESNGTWITIDSIFSDTVNLTLDYEVFIQAYDDARFWVSEFHADAFFVCSDKPNARFAWELKAKRRGYERERLQKTNESYEEIEQIYGPERYRKEDENV